MSHVARLTVLCPEVPYPPLHGGRVDMWRRIQAFARSGVQVQLICWSAKALTPDDLSALEQYTSDVLVLEQGNTLRYRMPRLRHLLRYPLGVALRAPSTAQWKELTSRVRKHRPAALWLEGVSAGYAARGLSRALGIALFIRCHNVEHLYWRRQADLAKRQAERLRNRLRALHLRRFEHEILAASDRYYDISVEDLQSRIKKGIAHGSWLPPFAAPWAGQGKSSASSKQRYDAVFLGNLRMPNNVDGIDWFIGEVMPEILRYHPRFSLLVAGSDPSERVRSLCARARQVTLMADPPDAETVLCSGRVLINPVRHGSGVAVKSIDMLFADRVAVSTSQGVAGLPEFARTCFLVADSPREFSQGVLGALLRGEKPHGDLSRARRAFHPNAVARVIEDIRAAGCSQAHSSDAGRTHGTKAASHGC